MMTLWPNKSLEPTVGGGAAVAALWRDKPFRCRGSRRESAAAPTSQLFR
jgi:hypothetical protein